MGTCASCGTARRWKRVCEDKRADLQRKLNHARETLPARPAKAVEDAVVAMHAYQLAAAIKLGPFNPAGVSAVTVMTVYCWRVM